MRLIVKRHLARLLEKDGGFSRETLAVLADDVLARIVWRVSSDRGYLPIDRGGTTARFGVLNTVLPAADQNANRDRRGNENNAQNNQQNMPPFEPSFSLRRPRFEGCFASGSDLKILVSHTFFLCSNFQKPKTEKRGFFSVDRFYCCWFGLQCTFSAPSTTSIAYV